MLVICVTAEAQNVTVNPGAGSYATLKAAFDKINDGTHTGAITIGIVGNTTEAASAVLNASGSGSASYTSVTITPTGARTVSGSVAGHLIDLNGADNVTINGLNAGGNSLVIENTNTGTSATTIRFIADATNNTIQNASIKGAGTSTTLGTIFFSTGTTTGNDNNTIQGCTIDNSGANFPINGIYSLGTSSTVANSSNTISNNNISNYFSAASASNGILLASTDSGNSGWTISSNRFFQTATRTYTTANTHKAISVGTGNGYLISNNLIGYATVAGTGTYTMAGTVATKFIGIDMTVGTTTASTIQGNTITAISLSGSASGTTTSSPFRAIYITGLVNADGNIIGSQSATGAITFNSTTTSSTDIYGIYNNGSSAFTLSNNQIGGMTVSTSSGTLSFYPVRINTVSTVVSTVTNNTIGGTVANSIQSTSTATGSQVVGILMTTSDAVMTNNIVRNISAAGGTGTTTSASIIGMSFVSTSVNNNVSQNTIYGLSNTNASAATTVTGIQYTSEEGVNSVSRNLIYGLTVASTSGIVNGIQVSNGETTFSNNIIRLGINTAGASQTVGSAINGINEISGTNNFYYNSIYIGGTGVANAGTTYAFISAATSNTRIYRNNIFFNARSNGAGTGKHYAIRVAGTAANPAGLTINHNDYFTTGTGGVLGLFNGTDITSIANWRTAVGQDVNSISADPKFINPTAAIPDLHITVGVATAIESAGLPIAGLTIDFDGDTRGNIYTDMGADEGYFTPIADIHSPEFVLVPLTNTCLSTDRSFTARITDATGVPTSGNLVPRVYYKKGFGGTWHSNPATLNSGTATDGTWTFTVLASDLVMLKPGDSVYYYLIAQDATANGYISSTPSGVVATDVNTVTTPPTTLNSYMYANLSQPNYNVGGAGDFTTLTAAIKVYNVACLNGPVTFTLTDPGYNTNETFPIVIEANPNASASNTLTIKPATNTAVNITSGAASHLLRLNGADHIIIDGVRDAGGTSLTFENTSTTANSAVIWLSSNGPGLGATNNIIRNVNIKAGADQKAGTTLTYGIVIAGSTLGTITGTAAGADNDNNLIDTCYFTKVRYGIFSRGASAANPNTGNIIKRNIVGPTSFGVDQIGKAGIVVREEEGIQIIGNEVRFVGGDYDNTSAGADRAGIVLATDATWNAPTSVYVKNASVRSNIIHDIQDERTNSALAIILAGADGSNATNNIIANNFIYNIKANGTGSDQAVGIGVAAGNADKVVYNSIYMGGAVNPTAAATVPTVPNVGIRVLSATPSNLSILNNVVYMDLVGGGALKNFCIDIPASYTWGTGNLDYNNWYANPANVQSNVGSVANGVTATAFSLSDWRNLPINSGKELNSRDQDPQFVSLTDLHLQASSPIDGQGTPVAGVTTDIDNENRSASFPDMGADEIPETIGLDLKPQGLVSPVTSPKGCYGPAESIVVKIKNNGSVVANFATSPTTITVNVGGSVTTTYTAILNSGTLTPGSTQNVTLTTVGTELDMSTPGVYTFDISVPIPGDVNTANDNLQELRTKESLTAGAATATPVGYCQTGGKPVLSTAGANGYSSLQWQQSTTAGSGYSNIAGATSASFTLPTAITQTMYYKLVATCGTAGTDESGELSVVFSNPQPTSTTPATRCGVGTVTLSATADAGKTIKWYAAATGGTPLATGNNFTTPVITSTSQYFAEASESSGGGGTFVVGAGSTTSNTYPTPFYSLWSNTHNQYLIRASELIAAGMSAGNINSLGITITAAGTLPVLDLSIKMANTTATDVTAFLSPTFTTVFTTPSLTPTTGLNTMTFSTPFAWDGSSNVVIEVCHGNSGSGATMSRTAEVDPTTFVSTIHTHKSAGSAGSATCADVTTNLTTYSIRPKFTFISTGCAGTRVQVTATVTPPPALTVTPSKTICNNATHELSVTSTVADFDSYIWTPATGLFLDAAATVPYNGTSASTVYAKNSTASTTTYTLTATNTATNCVNVATSTVIVMPAPTISAVPTNICVSGTSVITASALTGYGAGTLQWQSSPDGIAAYTNIAAATTGTYTTPTITQTSYYKLLVKDEAGATCSELLQTVIVTSPQIATTTPGSRCGVGTVSLGATATEPGNTVAWYTAATGGAPIGTGTNFTTPVISTTTNYYAASVTPGVAATTGMSVVSSNPTSGAGTTNFGLVFDVISAFTLNSVTIYPISATNATGSVTIDVINSSGTVVHTATVNVTGSPIATPQPQVVPLNFTIQPGTGYKIRPGARTGVSGLAFEPTAGAPGGNYGYPYVVPGVLSINTSTLSATNTPDNSLYYYFYNWQITTSCVGNRVAVAATVTPPPALTVTADKTICNNATHQLQVTSTIADFDSYVWTPATGLYTDAAATVPYVAGSSATEVYVKTATAAAITYTVTGTNNATSCVNVATSTVTVLPNPAISASDDDICISGSSVLSVQPATGYGAATFQWQSSPDGIAAYTNIATQTNSSYTTPTLTQSAYYKLVVKDGAGTTCAEPTKSIIVNNPQLTSTTPATRCGIGTVTLGATATGGTVNWYATATGGMPIATGNSFTTPALSATTTYYAAATAGSGGTTTAGLTNAISTTDYTLEAGLFFNALSDFTLQGVYVYPQGTGAGTAEIALINSAGTTVQTITVNLTGSATPPKTYVPLNWNITSGTDYRLMMMSRSGGVAGLIRESGSSWGSYPLTLPGVLSITNGNCCSGLATSTSYYYFYDWQISTACETSRTPVIATVTPGPIATITAAKTICNNEVHELKVTSTLTDFDSYTWSPVTGLYTDAAATVPYVAGSNATEVYVKTATAGATTYTMTANNSGSGCGTVATSVVTVMPNPTITISGEICVSGSTTLMLNPATGYGNGTFQWQSSPDGIAPYTNISSGTAATYNTPTLTQNAYYRLLLKDGSGTVCIAQPTKTVTINNPQIVGTTPGSRCGQGTVILGATGTVGSTLKWYTAATGGLSVHTGTQFTTPVINANTTYYVSASQGGGTTNVGKVDKTGSGAGSSLTHYEIFDVASSGVTINSVDIYPTTAGQAGIIEITNSSGTVLHTINYTTTVGGNALQTVPVNVSLPAGTAYRMRQGSPAISLFRNDGGASHPYAAGPVTITTNSFQDDYFYYFFNWSISTECTSARTAVTATVNNILTNATVLAGTAGGAQACSGNQDVSASTTYFDNCNLIATIAPSGGAAVSGNINACVKIDNTVPSAPNGQKYVQRYFEITPATNRTTATSTVTLYFTQAEFDAYNTAVAGTYPALPANSSDAAKANLRVSQFNHGGVGTDFSTYPAASGSIIDPADASITYDAAANGGTGMWAVTFNATGSGAFYVHTGNFVLPVTITNFRGETAGAINKLYWSTSTETNNKGFELERSTDGINYTKLTFVATKANGGNSSSQLSYSFDDLKPLPGTSYYRLKQIDNDGKFNYSGVVTLSRKLTQITLSKVFPNPATTELNVVITSPRAEKLTVVVTDLRGKVVMQTSTNVVLGENQQQLNVAKLAGGTYMVKVICADGCETAVHRFVKQ
jgi:hypothetical protein